MTQSLAILGCGCVSCVGFTAASTCAAIRAKVSGFTMTGFRDKIKGPTIWAEVPLSPSPLDANPFSRLVSLAEMALVECVETAGVDRRECPVLLGTREPFRVGPGVDWSRKALLAETLKSSGVAMHPFSRVFPEGNASCFAALSHARELLTSGHTKVCIVGGVDSLLNPADMRRFGNAYRLNSDEVAQGFVPGEAAAFLAVTREETARGLAKILGLALTREDDGRTVLSNRFSHGTGLEHAMLAAIRDSGRSEQDVAFRISDVNGETYRGLESMLAMFRVYRSQRSHLPHIYPASSVGETGAAAGALLLVVVVTALSKGYAPGSIGVCEASSDAGLRAACLVSRP